MMFVEVCRIGDSKGIAVYNRKTGAPVCFMLEKALEEKQSYETHFEGTRQLLPYGDEIATFAVLEKRTPVQKVVIDIFQIPVYVVGDLV